jgi:glycosyltransferase involved in cell wall biosynthesis
MTHTDSQLPLVSVIIPAYNAKAFIRDTLESVLSQTYSNVEVIVVDDGSQDETVEIVQDYCDRNSLITLIQQPNAGVAAARNRAIEAARGEYIAPIDADDVWYPKKLEKQVEAFARSRPGVGMVYAWSVDIDENHNNTGGFCAWSVEGNVYVPMIYTNFLGNASSPLIRRECFELVGGYKTQLKALNAQGCEDWDLYLRIAEWYQVRVIPELLIGYRQSGNSMSTNPETMRRSFEFMMQDVQRRHPEIPPTVFHWATSHYYCALAERSLGRGESQQALAYLFKAVQLDYLPLFSPGRYRLFLNSLLQLLNCVRTTQDTHQPAEMSESAGKSPSLDDIYRKINWRHQSFLGKQRIQLLERRWQRVAGKLTNQLRTTRVLELSR